MRRLPTLATLDREPHDIESDPQRPHRPIAQGPDPYAWLQNRDSDDVLDYLKAENAWQEAQLADQTSAREQLFEEIKARILETDLSLPSPWGLTCITPAPQRATNMRATTAARARLMTR